MMVRVKVDLGKAADARDISAITRGAPPNDAASFCWMVTVNEWANSQAEDQTRATILKAGAEFGYREFLNSWVVVMTVGSLRTWRCLTIWSNFSFTQLLF
jgi:gluconate kinase